MSSGYKLAQIINMLRKMEVGLPLVKTVGQVCCSLGFSEQSYYRWRLTKVVFVLIRRSV